jgi:hypothetical protein
MKNIKEALQLTTVDELANEISERHKLIDSMVGTLYPEILSNEIYKLEALHDHIVSTESKPIGIPDKDIYL